MDRYDELCRLYPSVTKILEPWGRGEFVTPMWQQYISGLSMQCDPCLPKDFLVSCPTIVGTMYANPKLIATLIPEVERMLGKSRDLAFLQGDEFGQGPRKDYWVTCAGVETTWDTIQKVYQLLRLRAGAKWSFTQPHTVIEWGGGYGCFAKVLRRRCKGALTYIDIDLPEMIPVIWFYLSMLFGPGEVKICTEPGELEDNKFNLIPLGAVDKFELMCDTFTSHSALHESTNACVDYVFEKAFFQADNLFISGFQDSYALSKIIAEQDATVEPYPPFDQVFVFGRGA